MDETMKATEPEHQDAVIQYVSAAIRDADIWTVNWNRGTRIVPPTPEQIEAGQNCTNREPTGGITITIDIDGGAGDAS